MRRRSGSARSGPSTPSGSSSAVSEPSSRRSPPTRRQPPPVSGPVGIATQIGDVFWQLGPLFTLYVAGILSANLAVVNILPFPPLDGGRMLMITLKRVFGARISLRAEQLTYMVGFVFLFAFLIWITGVRHRPPGSAADPDPAMSSPDALRPRRRPTVSVDVGGVLVGIAPTRSSSSR